LCSKAIVVGSGAAGPTNMLDLGGDISGNGLSKLFLTIAAAFAEAERDRILRAVDGIVRTASTEYDRATKNCAFA
jgi:DNA invertase Pin-like site-specific DNA recombinase